MILEKDDKVVVSYRRLFAEDDSRFFVGIINEYEGGLARATGHNWTWAWSHGMFLRDKAPRAQIIPTLSHGLIVVKVDRALDLTALEVKVDANENATLTNGRGFELELTSGSANPLRQALTRT